MPIRLTLFGVFLAAVVLSLCRAPVCGAVEPIAEPATPSVAELFDTVRKSVVVITVTGRDGRQEGIGSGFVVDPGGLIATNYHVIGDGRAISVQLADGRRFDVAAIHASDRAADLAVVRIDANELPALAFGAMGGLQTGQPMMAIGSPHGLDFSVVTGVVSGTRDFDGRSMIQLAIPIEPGNSGGPLLDLKGNVYGILTMKSQVTPNLGFAVPIDALRPLLEKPNPIPIDRWLTLGALDPAQWEPLFGARWRRRGGRVLVEGAGEGFGGRSLCLSKSDAPEFPYELAVSVKLDNEGGAAGLAFGADGNDAHFGFYPTAGKLRLTHFGGPDLSSWNILRDEPSRFYLPGQWNLLKVRVEADRIRCFVNEQLVFDVGTAVPAKGRIGLAKFRDTRAEFKRFQFANEIPSTAASPELTAQIETLLGTLPDADVAKEESVAGLAAAGTGGIVELRRQAAALERRASQLRSLADAVRVRQVLDRLAEAFRAGEAEADLWHAALLIAALDNEELDVEAYREELDRMAAELKRELPTEADEATRLAALHRYLFETNGFHGSRHDYYTRSNSYVNDVIDDRGGIPITLSVLYMELARRIDLKVEGVGLPGHFVVRHAPREGEPALIDVYEGGATLTADDARKRVFAVLGQEPDESAFAATGNAAIVARMLKNLLGVAQSQQDLTGMLRYLDATITVQPDAASDRWLRAVCRYQAGQLTAAREDCDWLLARQPQNIEMERVHELRDVIETQQQGR